MKEFPDIRLGYGESDEYSFILHKSSDLYGESLLIHQEALSSLHWVH